MEPNGSFQNHTEVVNVTSCALEGEAALVYVIVLLIALTGIFGNALVINVYLKRKDLNAYEMYKFVLAVLDFVVCLFFHPSIILFMLGCSTKPYSTIVRSFASFAHIFSMLLFSSIACHRLVSLLQPRNIVQEKKFAKGNVVFVFVLSFLVSLVAFTELISSETVRKQAEPWFNRINLIFFFLSLTLAVGCYFSIFIIIYRSRRSKIKPFEMKEVNKNDKRNSSGANLVNGKYWKKKQNVQTQSNLFQLSVNEDISDKNSEDLHDKSFVILNRITFQDLTNKGGQERSSENHVKKNIGHVTHSINKNRETRCLPQITEKSLCNIDFKSTMNCKTFPESRINMKTLALKPESLDQRHKADQLTVPESPTSTLPDHHNLVLAKSAVTMVIITAFFFFSYFPHIFGVVLGLFNPKGLRFLSLLQFAVNPIVYCIMNVKFREQIFRVLRRH